MQIINNMSTIIGNADYYDSCIEQIPQRQIGGVYYLYREPQ